MSAPKSWLLGLFLGCALAASSVLADEAAPPADAKTVVADQIKAFERGDAAGAWSLAAPEIQQRFVSPAKFFAEVQENYGPIARHRSVDFGAVTPLGDEVGMTVTLVDDDNEVWSALFVLTQEHGSWRTAGCLLSKADETSL